MADALLALADGTVFQGRAFGATGETFGEVVFNTGLTGYQEVLTDPSYHGQIVAMTYPHQGNYGVNDDDAESSRPWVAGFVVREFTRRPSSWRSEESLDSYLRRTGVVAISGVDTRRLVRHVRSHGAMPAGVTSTDTGESEFVDRVRNAPGIVGRDLVSEVTPGAAYDADPATLAASSGTDPVSTAEPDPRMAGARIAAVDYGMKRNILRCLTSMGCSVRVFGASTTAAEIGGWAPDGVFLSNGPGDPAALPYAVETVRAVVESGVPTFGICLGHQMLGQALGGAVYKLGFGHRGANHPVKSLVTGRVEITTQNHGFAISMGTRASGSDTAWKRLAGADPADWTWSSALGDVALTHFDLNDGTLEGIRCRELPAFSVQYHPEAAPGPHDSRYLFGDFAQLVAEHR